MSIVLILLNDLNKHLAKIVQALPPLSAESIPHIQDENLEEIQEEDK